MISGFLCAIHCLILPLLISARLLLTDTAIENWEHFDYFFLILGLIACYVSASHTDKWQLKIAFWGLYCLLCFSIVLHEQIDFLKFVSISASIGLASLHLVNLFLNKQKTSACASK